LFIIIN